MLVVISEGKTIARIFKSTQSEFGHRHSEPWLLKRVTGRVDRFRTLTEAKAEAKKSWIKASFHKSMVK